MRIMRRYAAVLFGAVLASAGIPAAAASTAAIPAAPQASATFTFLDGVFCTSAASCWAVGAQQGGIAKAIDNQVLHWNGRTWRRVRVPDPGGAGPGRASELDAVRCVTARDCWAVGQYSKGAAQVNEALHWNGKRWALTRTPSPGGSHSLDESELDDSTCVTSANCWAVGDFGGPTGTTKKRLNLVLHWNGRTWSRTRVLNPAGSKAGDLNSLFAVRCGSASDCNAVGEYGPDTSTTDILRNEVLHWNGKKWALVKTPNPGGTANGDQNALDGLACGSSTSCFAVGSYGALEPTTTMANEIVHWNGKKWAKVSAPNPDGTKTGDSNELFGGTCDSSSDCWAVGGYGTSIGSVERNQALHWNGKKWTLIKTPEPGGTSTGDLSALLATRCPSAGDCWAVGVQQHAGGNFRNEILHWNGKRWSVG